MISHKISANFIILLILDGTLSNDVYNRNAFERKYPGFGTDWLPMAQDKTGFVIGYFKEPVEQRIFTPKPEKAVKFTLFTRENDDKGVEIKHFNTTDSILDKSKPIKFIIHGWMAKGTSSECVRIKDHILEKYDASVFIVDWNKISGSVMYTAAMKATHPVGQFIATFLEYITNLGVDPKNIHIIGHSLGAHVSGFAARSVKKGKIGRITGLDPARPGFDFGFFTNGRLSQTDALFVDVIHTCAGYLGHPEALGHADFFPNDGGPPQPECRKAREMIEACSHSESWRYYSQSLSNPGIFKAYRCKSWVDFEDAGETCSKEPMPMGDPVPATARGNYYLSTVDVPSVQRSATNG